MAAFFQLLRQQFGSRSFLIVQTAPIDDTIQDHQSLSEIPRENDVRNSSEGSEGKAETLNLNSDEAGKEMSSSKACLEKQRSTATESSGSSTRAPLSDSASKAKLCNKSSDSNKPEVDLESLYSGLKSSNSIEIRCKNSLDLALCLSQDLCDIEFSECLAAINHLSDSHNHPHLAVCHAILLCAFTKLSMSLKELSLLEGSILRLAEAVLETSGTIKKMCRVEILTKRYSEQIFKLCKELFPESYLDVNKIDISTICCSSLCNLSAIIMQHDAELGAKYSYKNNTLMYVLEMTGKSTQEIVSEHMSSSFQKHTCPSISSHRIKQCLQILEHALSINPDLSHCESLQHDNFSLPHCLTRLLGWSVSSLFPVKNIANEDSEAVSYFKFHLSTLVCILKILSVLTFNPTQYDTFTNVKGLMEKILICTLKAYFESEENHFDIQILCLEILINLYLKNQKTFILLCLKKFRISESEEVLAIEALLKMLSDNLEKIKEVKQSAPYPQANNEDTSNQDSSKKETTNSELVLQAASKDMEHSTIVSFICVLLVFFIRTKQSFKEFIQERLTSEVLQEATIVSKKFLEFASITGGMPVTGILILTQTVNKLQALQS